MTQVESGRLGNAYRTVADHPPPGPFHRDFWRSPLRGPWFTAVFGLVLLVGISVLFVTGLFSYAAYNPGLGGPNDLTPSKGILGFYLFAWPTSPSWLYWVNQGTHVLLGLTLIPVLLAKLWSVAPKLFDWPPVMSVAQAVERLSLLLLVGGAVFEFATGVFNIQYLYIFPGSFYRLHFYGAWVFIAAFAAHVAIRFPRMVAGLRARSLGEVMRTDVAGTEAEPPDPHHLVSPAPAPATISRRGALGLVGAGSLTLLVLSIGQTVGGPLRQTALLSPRGQDRGSGPNAFQINKTAADRGVTSAMVGPSYRLELADGNAATRQFSREALLALPQHTSHLPIACVEGWSTGVQEWAGVRLRDLAALAGVPDPGRVFVESLQPGGGFRTAFLRRNQVLDPDSLLALKVNGADLSLDHGFPARIIVPANPGVHNTKWVARLRFERV